MVSCSVLFFLSGSITMIFSTSSHIKVCHFLMHHWFPFSGCIGFLNFFSDGASIDGAAGMMQGLKLCYVCFLQSNRTSLNVDPKFLGSRTSEDH